MSIQQINNLTQNLTVKLSSDYYHNDDILSKIEQYSKIEHKNGADFFDLLFSVIPKYFENKRNFRKINQGLLSSNIDFSIRA